MDAESPSGTSHNHSPAPATRELFRADAYLRECTARVLALRDGCVVLDQTVFYPLGGGQGGDAGVLLLPGGGEVAICDTRKGKHPDGSPNGEIWHQIADQPASNKLELLQQLEQLVHGAEALTARVDWDRRHRMMRFHTSTHLLCHLVPHLVNGCSITPDYARMDFAMTEPLDKDALTEGIARLVAAALPVTVGSITDAELDANPSLVKSMSVQPPRGSGVVRTITVGAQAPIDLQPCGGTHVANTTEIGSVIVTKIEKKSATTRRVVLGFA